MKQPIICIAGPTASGKTGLAVALAERLNGEVVSCDSMQVYRGMDVGTAKPTAEEMRNVPHHLLSVAAPDEVFSVGRYVELADRAVQDILSRGKAAIVAGGTGLYMDSLILGRAFAAPSDPALRAALEQEAEAQGAALLLERLRAVDPATAARLHPSDRKRIVRALEVYTLTGQTIAAHNAQTLLQPPRYAATRLVLTFEPRALLYERIDRRVDEMVRRGLFAEVQSLLDRGVPAEATSMQAIGYKETALALRGQLSAQEAVAQIMLGSRRYAKRQLTWFRRWQDARWLVRTDERDPLTQALALLAQETAAP